MTNEQKLRAELILLQMEALQNIDAVLKAKDAYAMLNEILRDAKSLAESILSEEEKKSA